MNDYYEKMNGEMSKEDKKMYGDYETKERAEEDMHTLAKAQEIKSDKERMKMAIHCAKKKREALDAVTKGE